MFKLTLILTAVALAVVAALTGGVGALGLLSLSGGLTTLAVMTGGDDAE